MAADIGPLAVGGDEPHYPDREASLRALETGHHETQETMRRVESGISQVLVSVSGLDIRLSHVEDRLSKVESTVHRVELDTAELKGRVSQLPSTIQLLGFVVAVFVAGGFFRHFFP